MGCNVFDDVHAPSFSVFMEMEDVIEDIRCRNRWSPLRTKRLASLVKNRFAQHGNPHVKPEVAVQGYVREKCWDLAWTPNGAARLAVSLKTIGGRNGGRYCATMVNRLDDVVGEMTSVKLANPDIVTGYMVLIDVRIDSFSPKFQCRWSQWFRDRLDHLVGGGKFINGLWLASYDSTRPYGDRLVDPQWATDDLDRCVKSLIADTQRA